MSVPCVKARQQCLTANRHLESVRLRRDLLGCSMCTREGQ